MSPNRTEDDISNLTFLEEDDLSNQTRTILDLYQEAGYGRWCVGLILYVLSFLTTVGNGLVLHAIRTERRLQTVSNMFIMSLAIADLIVGIVVIPISATAFILGPEWHFGRVICQVFLTIDYTASTASIFNLCILSLDRYWSITSPLRYLRKRTKKRALLMIGLAWIGSAVWFIPVLGWHHFLYQGTRQTKENECETEFEGSVPFKVISAIVNFHIPSGCMVVLYVRIFLAIKRRSVEIARISNASQMGYSNNGAHENDSYTEDAVEGFDTKQAEETNNLTLFKSNLARGSEVNLLSSSQYSLQEFSHLTLISLPNNNTFKQSMVISHSEYDGIKVSVEYVDNVQISYTCYRPGTPRYENCKIRPVKSVDQSSQVQHRNTHRTDSYQQKNNHSTRRSSKSKQTKPNFRCCWPGNVFIPLGQENSGKSRKTTSDGKRKKKKGRKHKSKGSKGSSGNMNGRRKNSSNSCGKGRSSGVQGHQGLAREKKAATQLGVILGAFICSWLPYFTLFMIVAYCDSYPDQCSVPPLLFQTTIWCGYLNSTLNPILYPLCNSNFKLAFKRILSRKRG